LRSSVHRYPSTYPPPRDLARSELTEATTTISTIRELALISLPSKPCSVDAQQRLEELYTRPRSFSEAHTLRYLLVTSALLACGDRVTRKPHTMSASTNGGVVATPWRSSCSRPSWWGPWSSSCSSTCWCDAGCERSSAAHSLDGVLGGYLLDTKPGGSTRRSANPSWKPPSKVAAGLLSRGAGSPAAELSSWPVPNLRQATPSIKQERRKLRPTDGVPR
jgi:hypothetical protein